MNYQEHRGYYLRGREWGRGLAIHNDTKRGAYEADNHARHFTPFEFTAHEINELGEWESNCAWEAFDLGISDEIETIFMGNRTAQLQEDGITFDWAVPQPWLDDVMQRAANELQPNGRLDHLVFVWCYPEGASVFGVPAPRNLLGEVILEITGEVYLDPETGELAGGIDSWLS